MSINNKLKLEQEFSDIRDDYISIKPQIIKLQNINYISTFFNDNKSEKETNYFNKLAEVRTQNGEFKTIYNKAEKDVEQLLKENNIEQIESLIAGMILELNKLRNLIKEAEIILNPDLASNGVKIHRQKTYIHNNIKSKGKRWWTRRRGGSKTRVRIGSKKRVKRRKSSKKSRKKRSRSKKN
jgi:hypothetical protein